MTAIPFTITNDTITVTYKGEPHTVRKGAANFLVLKKALLEESWDEVPKFLEQKTALTTWAKGRFTVAGDTFSYDGQEIPTSINERIVKMAARGEDPSPLFKFWERLAKNPSWRSVQQLYTFLVHEGIPLTLDGCFLAYKSVRRNYLDHHSGTVENRPGKVIEMPRNQISDDPKEACHVGFHVGALSYAQSFGSDDRIILVCKVDPENVVCVPYDESQRKMRVCKYFVVGHYGAQLPDTTIGHEDLPPENEDEDQQETTAEDDAKLCECGHSHGDHSDDDSSCDECEDCTGFEEAKGEDQDEDPYGEKDEPKKKKAEPKEKPKAPEAPPKDRKSHPFDKLDIKGLLEKPIQDLRDYAGKSLRIIGASKIPGGKTALAARILEVRDGRAGKG